MRDDRRLADLGGLQLDEAGWLSIALAAMICSARRTVSFSTREI